MKRVPRHLSLRDNEYVDKLALQSYTKQQRHVFTIPINNYAKISKKMKSNNSTKQ